MSEKTQLEEGKVKKGGRNTLPITPRPDAPKGEMNEEMNETMAKEIVAEGSFKIALGSKDPEWILDIGIAIGYLKGIKKAKELEKIVEKEFWNLLVPILNLTCSSQSAEGMRKELDRILSKYREQSDLGDLTKLKLESIAKWEKGI
jgi:hypothetical protein